MFIFYTFLPIIYVILFIVLQGIYYKWHTKEENTILSSLILGLSIIMCFSYTILTALNEKIHWLTLILFILLVSIGFILNTKKDTNSI